MAKDKIETQAAKPTTTKIKSYLKSKGHKSAVVDAEKYTSDEDKIKSILKLHGVSVEEYAAGKIIRKQAEKLAD